MRRGSGEGRATRTSGRRAHPRRHTWTAEARRRGVHTTPARRICAELRMSPESCMLSTLSSGA
eukprot:5619472-Prymnesium_polylepis.1